MLALQARGPEFKPQSPFKERWVWWHVLTISAPGKRKWRQADPGVAGQRLHGVFQAREGLSQKWRISSAWGTTPEAVFWAYTHTHTPHSHHIRVCIILEASHLLTLHQQSHPRRFSFWLQFLVFLFGGPVDPHRRHLFLCYCYFHRVHLSRAKL